MPLSPTFNVVAYMDHKSHGAETPSNIKTTILRATAGELQMTWVDKFKMAAIKQWFSDKGINFY
jgi:hypothetical protein